MCSPPWLEPTLGRCLAPVGRAGVLGTHSRQQDRHRREPCLDSPAAGDRPHPPTRRPGEPDHRGKGGGTPLPALHRLHPAGRAARLRGFPGVAQVGDDSSPLPHSQVSPAPTRGARPPSPRDTARPPSNGYPRPRGYHTVLEQPHHHPSVLPLSPPRWPPSPPPRSPPAAPALTQGPSAAGATPRCGWCWARTGWRSPRSPSRSSASWSPSPTPTTTLARWTTTSAC